MSKKKDRLFTTDCVDDEMYMCADIHLYKTFKDGLEINLERQNGSSTVFTIYRQGVVDLNNFLTKWLEENK